MDAPPRHDTPFHDLDRFIALPRLSRLVINPDGTRLVSLVSTLDARGAGYASTLWEIDPAGANPARRIAHLGGGNTQAAFSGSGDLFFTSRRTDHETGRGMSSGTALWMLPAAGGEARRLVTRLGGVDAVHTASHSRRVVVTADVLPGCAPDDDAARLLCMKHRVTAILHSAYPVRHWGSDLGPGRPHLCTVEIPPERGAEDGPGEQDRPCVLRDLTPDIGFGLHRGGVEFAPDGRFLLAAVTTPTDGVDAAVALCRIDLDTGVRSVLLTDPDHDYAPGPISPDGREAVLTVVRRPTPRQAPREWLAVLDLDTGALRRVAEDWDRWAKPLAWFPDGRSVLVTADDEGRAPLFRVTTADGSVDRLTPDDAAYSEAVVHPDGLTVYAVRSSWRYPPEVVRVDVASGRVHTLRNPTARPALPGTVEEVVTTAGDGTRLRAWLAVPDTASATEPAPLSLWVHGGPMTSWNAWSWLWNPWPFVAAGHAVLLPDPALSTGYGQDFLQRGWGRWGAEPYTDLLTLVDAVQARPDIDDARASVMGGSFGGYMANWIAGHTTRFAAIVSHASLWALDQVGPASDAATYWARLMGPQEAREFSPHRSVQAIATPMLVVHGDKDYRVPIGEGLRMWYEVLAHSALPATPEGGTEHRLLYFPDEGHWVRRPHHAKLWYATTLGFVNQHVRGVKFEPPAELGSS